MNQIPRMSQMINWFLKRVSSVGFKLGLCLRDKKNIKLSEEALQKQQNNEEDIDSDLNEQHDEVEFSGPTINEKILRIAALEMGVKELKGEKNSERVMKYHLFASEDNDVDHPDSVPWCSSFICFVVEKAGLSSTNSLMARSWEYWGESSMHDPIPGDIVVFWRKSQKSGFGHVGVFLGKRADNNIAVLGGNQKDEVNISIFSPHKIVDIRRESEISPLVLELGETLEIASRVV